MSSCSEIFSQLAALREEIRNFECDCCDILQQEIAALKAREPRIIQASVTQAQAVILPRFAPVYADLADLKPKVKLGLNLATEAQSTATAANTTAKTAESTATAASATANVAKTTANKAYGVGIGASNLAQQANKTAVRSKGIAKNARSTAKTAQ